MHPVRKNEFGRVPRFNPCDIDAETERLFAGKYRFAKALAVTKGR